MSLVNISTELVAGMQLNKGSSLTGKYFNKIYEGVRLYSFLDNDLKWLGVQYKLGLNLSSNSNLHFCQESMCHIHYFYRERSEHLTLQNHKSNLALVTIPDDAEIYIEENDFKTDKLSVEYIMCFSDIPDNFWLNLTVNEHRAFEYVKEQSYDICILAVQRNGLALQYVKNEFRTEKVCTLAVQQNCLALQYVPGHCQTESMCKEAIQQNVYALQYVNCQSYDLCLSIVQRNGLALEHVEAQTQVICNIAVQQNCYALKYVKKEYQTDQMCIAAIEKNIHMFEYVKNHTPYVCEYAVQKDGMLLKYIKDPTNFICELAVQQNGNAIQFVAKQTSEICDMALKQNWGALRHIRTLQWIFYAFVMYVFCMWIF